MQTECLVEGRLTRLEVEVRFLHPMAREIGRLPSLTRRRTENSKRLKRSPSYGWTARFTKPGKKRLNGK